MPFEESLLLLASIFVCNFKFLFFATAHSEHWTAGLLIWVIRDTTTRNFFSHLCILYGSIVSRKAGFFYASTVFSTFSASNVYWFLACLQTFSSSKCHKNPYLQLSSKLLWFDLLLHSGSNTKPHASIAKKSELFWGSNSWLL